MLGQKFSIRICFKHTPFDGTKNLRTHTIVPNMPMVMTNEDLGPVDVAVTVDNRTTNLVFFILKVPDQLDCRAALSQAHGNARPM